MPSPHIFVVLSTGVGVVGFNLYKAYAKIYDLSYGLRLAKGYQLDDPRVDRTLKTSVGIGGTAVLGVALLMGQMKLYTKALTIQSPAQTREFRSTFKLPPPNLSPALLYKHLGPPATVATLRQFWRWYGIHTVSFLTASVVCTLICAHFQPVFESLVCPKQEENAP